MKNNTAKELESLDYHALTEAIRELDFRAQCLAESPTRFRYCATEEQLFSIESRFGRGRMVEAWNQLPEATLVKALALCDESLGDAGATLLLPEKIADLLAQYKKYDEQFQLAHMIRCGFVDQHGKIQEDRAIDTVSAIFQNEASRDAFLELLSRNPHTATINSFTECLNTISQENDFSCFDDDLLLMALLYTVQDAEIGILEWLTRHLFNPLTGERMRRQSTEVTQRQKSFEHEEGDGIDEGNAEDHRDNDTSDGNKDNEDHQNGDDDDWR